MDVSADQWCSQRYDRNPGEAEPDNLDHHNDFGFVTLDRPHTLDSFKAYADWVKACHFSEPPPQVCS